MPDRVELDHIDAVLPDPSAIELGTVRAAGRVWVYVAVGDNLRIALTPEHAAELADALKVEAAFAEVAGPGPVDQLERDPNAPGDMQGAVGRPMDTDSGWRD